MIAWLLHIANTYPAAVDREAFYAMKSRILRRWGQPEWFDVQHIPGKECWSCDGTGGLWEAGGCYKCFDGWYKRPVWVTLHRYRLGRYVFHIPGAKTHTQPEPDITRIVGYVQHPDYGYRKPEWACIALGLLFDRALAWRGICDKWHRQRWLRSLRQRCGLCQRRTWNWSRFRCHHCEQLMALGHLQEEVPF